MGLNSGRFYATGFGKYRRHFRNAVAWELRQHGSKLETLHDEFLNKKRGSYIKRESQAQSYRVSLKTMVKALQQEGQGSG